MQYCSGSPYAAHSVHCARSLHKTDMAAKDWKYLTLTLDPPVKGTSRRPDVSGSHSRSLRDPIRSWFSPSLIAAAELWHDIPFLNRNILMEFWWNIGLCEWCTWYTARYFRSFFNNKPAFHNLSWHVSWKNRPLRGSKHCYTWPVVVKRLSSTSTKEVFFWMTAEFLVILIPNLLQYLHASLKT